MTNSTCSIVNLFVKSRHGAPMTERQELSLKAGYGIEGDVNANSISPRQILIVCHEDLDDLSISPGELRENIVISGVNFESFIPGSAIEFDGGVAIRLTFYCEPCKRIKHLVKSYKSIEKKRGILGVVLSDGLLKSGTGFDLHLNMFPALSETPYERFFNFLMLVPSGKVITYKQVIMGMGVDPSYFRAIPKYLQKATANDYPVHRVLDSEGALTPHVPFQREKLEAEGVRVISGASLSKGLNKSFVPLEDYLWSDSTVYLV
jgi:alkylated DNA nucleotide flippase Atl1